jgi:hypothetical protein
MMLMMTLGDNKSGKVSNQIGAIAKELGKLTEVDE